MADLTTEFAAYLAALYDTNVGVAADSKTDLTTFVAKDLATVRASVAGNPQIDDANTMYLAYLL